MDRLAPGYLARFVRGYLRERIIHWGNHTWTFERGVPQGSVLGPLLWNIAYDGLLRLPLPEGIQLVGFADDVAVVATHNHAITLERRLRLALQEVDAWLQHNGLELAVHKTKATFLARRPPSTGDPPRAWLREQIIPLSPSVQYLGLQLDSNMAYQRHITSAVEKSIRVVNSLAGLMANVQGPRARIRRLILSAAALNKLLYGAPVWSHVTTNNARRRQFERVGRSLTLRIFSTYRKVSGEALGVIACVPPIHQLAAERRTINEGTAEHLRHMGTNKRAYKIEARNTLLEDWQYEWTKGLLGRWTYRLLPDLRSWTCEHMG